MREMPRRKFYSLTGTVPLGHQEGGTYVLAIGTPGVVEVDDIGRAETISGPMTRQDPFQITRPLTADKLLFAAEVLSTEKAKSIQSNTTVQTPVTADAFEA